MYLFRYRLTWLPPWPSNTPKSKDLGQLYKKQSCTKDAGLRYEFTVFHVVSVFGVGLFEDGVLLDGDCVVDEHWFGVYLADHSLFCYDLITKICNFDFIKVPYKIISHTDSSNTD